MRNKSILIYSFLTILLVVLSFSCQKFEKQQDSTIDQEIALKDANFSPEFDWETSRNITLTISSTNSQIVTITSADKSIRFHKGMFSNEKENYVVKINVPTHIDKLNINNQEFDLSSENIFINL